MQGQVYTFKMAGAPDYQINETCSGPATKRANDHFNAQLSAGVGVWQETSHNEFTWSASGRNYTAR